MLGSTDDRQPSCRGACRFELAELDQGLVYLVRVCPTNSNQHSEDRPGLDELDVFDEVAKTLVATGVNLIEPLVEHVLRLLQIHPDLDNTLPVTLESDEVPPSSWFDSLESLTKQHEGDVVTIEVLALDIGDEYEAEEVPFAYIEYDRHDDALNVAVGGRDGRYPVILRHTIEHPQRIVVSSAALGEDSTVDVTAADGVQTLITFHQRPALPA